MMKIAILVTLDFGQNYGGLGPKAKNKSRSVGLKSLCPNIKVKRIQNNPVKFFSAIP